jgi:hypothetical protein
MGPENEEALLDQPAALCIQALSKGFHADSSLNRQVPKSIIPRVDVRRFDIAQRARLAHRHHRGTRGVSSGDRPASKPADVVRTHAPLPFANRVLGE